MIKNCYSRHADKKQNKECIEQRACDMIFAFGKGLGETPKDSEEAVFEIFAVARGWAAIGISDDELMVRVIIL